MDVPLRAFELLAENNPEEATLRAKHLSQLNTERKSEVARMMKEAKMKLRARDAREVIVIGNPSWRVGVVGIVANQLAEEFDRPAFGWGREGSSHIKGSCRSDGRINMVELMCALPSGIFLDKGGHEFSGGFSVGPESIHLLEDALIKAHGEIPKKEKPTSRVVVDGELSVSAVNEETFSAITRLAPFGVGNPKPHFIFSGAEIMAVSRFGKEKNHLKLTLTDRGGGRAEAIGFFMTQADFPNVDLSAGSLVDMTAALEQSNFRGRSELRLRIADIAPR
jgi:single-stranded-DNA-specific exonuclease